MRYLDMQTWSRREHFEFYSAFDHPHFGMCANVDLTAFYRAAEEGGHSINVAIVYVLSRAANAIPQFRHRMRAGQVVEHDVVHPSTTILTNEDVFSFCTLDYVEDFPAFAATAAEMIARVRENPTLEDPPGRDDLLYMTAIPWVSFTSFRHPMHLHPADSVPRFAWGRFFEDEESVQMPLDVQGHHALMDGLHMGRFFEGVQDYLHHPDIFLGEG
jgi:chloramphenicol O-acetyltransferase type A